MSAKIHLEVVTVGKELFGSIDMCPHTCHVENVVRLERIAGSPAFSYIRSDKTAHMKQYFTLATSILCYMLAHAQLNNGLIAYYPFNSGNTGNQAPTAFSTLFAQQTSPTANAFGTPNQALAFSGSAPQLWVSSGGLIDFGTTTSFSFITDFKSGSAAEQNFFRDLLINGNGWRIGFYNNAGYVTFETGAGSNAISIHTTAIYNDLAWHQVALLVDKVNLTVKIHVDNVLQELAGTICGADITGTVADISTCNFNANEDNAQLTTFGEDLQGALDEIRLYGRLLSEDEVSEAYVLSFGSTAIVELGSMELQDHYDPSSHFLQLSGLGTAPCQVSVIDEQGRIQMHRSTRADMLRLDLTGLANGVYTVRCTHGEGNWAKRYVVVN